MVPKLDLGQLLRETVGVEKQMKCGVEKLPQQNWVSKDDAPGFCGQ